MKERQILTGVGYLYIAPVGSTFPAVNAAPTAPWAGLGETQDGITLTMSESLERIHVDQRTGAVKVVRTEESIQVETNLALATMDNLATMTGNSVASVAPSAVVIGTDALKLHKGFTVAEYALLYRGTFSPEDDDDGGPYPAQFELPRVHLSGDVALAFQKGANAQIPFSAELLEDLDAADPTDSFGRLIVQSASTT